MPRGPNGQWRPPGDNECAAIVCRIATGDSEEIYEPPARPDPVADSRQASRAGKASAASMTAEERRARAKRASDARWKEAQP